MQDTRTGEMRPLNVDIPKQPFKNRITDIMRGAGREAGIPDEHQGPVFEIGEILVIKGGGYKVRGFEGGLLHLEGIPK